MRETSRFKFNYFIRIILFFVLLVPSFTILGADYAESETITIEHPTLLRESSFFGRSASLLGYLDKGDKAEILSIDTDKVYGVGMKVRVTSGVKKGVVGWIYYAKDPEKRKVSVQDKNGETILHNSSDFFEEFNDQAKKFKARGIHVFKSTPGQNPVVLRESPSTIWKKIKSGAYQVDNDQDQGGPLIPIKKTYTGKDGRKRSLTFYMERDVNELMSLPEEVKEGLKIPISCFEPPTMADGPEAHFSNWLPGCEILSTRLDTNSYNELSACLGSIKAAALEGAGSNMNIDRDVVYKNLYSKLNSKEQEFAAMTLTSFGEAGILAPPLEEMVMIMKVLNNRKNYAINKGFDQANELDVATQHMQFSMWNKNDPNWKRALKANTDNPHTVNSLKAYIKYQNADYSSNTEVNKIYHYHTEYVQPDWSRGETHNPVTINNNLLKQTGRRHMFFESIPWSFRYHSTKREMVGN